LDIGVGKVSLLEVKKNRACRMAEKAERLATMAGDAVVAAEIEVEEFAKQQADRLAKRKILALEGAATYGTRRGACRASRTSWKEFHQWLREDQEFKDAFEDAILQHIDLLEDTLFDRAINGIPKDWPAVFDPRYLQMALEGRHPAYGKKRVEVSGGADFMEKLKEVLSAPLAELGRVVVDAAIEEAAVGGDVMQIEADAGVEITDEAVCRPDEKDAVG